MSSPGQAPLPVGRSYIDQIASGQPAAAMNPVDPRADFVATHNRASNNPGGSSGSSFIDQLAGEGEGARPTPTVGGKPPVPPPPQSNLPIGLQFENWMKAAGQRLSAMTYVPEGQREDKTLGDALRKGFLGVPSAMANAFVDALGTVKKDVLPQNLQDALRLINGPPGMQAAMDVGNLIMAPATAALSSAAGRPVEQQTGIKRDITGNLLSMFAPAGVFGKLGKFEELSNIAKAGGEAKAVEGEAGLAKPPAGEVPPAAAVAPKPGEAKPELEPPMPAGPAFHFVGENEKPTIKPTATQEEAFGRYMTGAEPTAPIEVNMETLANPATRGQAILDLSKVLPKDRIVPDDVVRMNAYSTNATPAEVFARLKGHEQLIYDNAAAQTFLDKAGDEFGRLSLKAMQSGDPKDMEQALAAYAATDSMQTAFRAARGEQGRAFRWLQQEAGAAPALGRRVSDMIAAAGSDATPEELVKRAAGIATDDTRKIAPWVATLQKMTSRDGMLFGWYNVLLSNPAIIFKKAASDSSLGLFNIATRYTAEKLGMGGGAIARGETMALVHGYGSAWREAIQIAGRALRAGQSQFHGEFNSLQDGSAIDRISKLANGAPAGYEANQVTVPAWNYIHAALPTSWIGAADDFAKVMNYRAEVSAGAWRRAVKEIGDSDPDKLNELYAQYKNNVPEALHEEALGRALRNTLQEPLDGVAKTIQDVIDKINVPLGWKGVQFPLGRFISPFTKISANVMRFVYRSSPLPLAAPTASFRAAMDAGGAQRALALAQVGLGTGVTMAALPFVLDGHITGGGPSNPDERYAWLNAGNKPYHITLPGGASFPYNKVEPFGTTLAMLADTADLAGHLVHQDEDGADLASSLALGMGHAMLSKTYMEQWSNLLDALSDPAKKGERFADNLAASFAVPGLVSGTDRLFDGYMRAHQGLMETIASRTPGMSNAMPPTRDVWGDPIKRPTGLFGGLGRMLLPSDIEAPPDVNPIDKWTWDHRDAFPDSEQGRMGFTPPGRIFHVEDVKQDLHIPLTTEQVDRLKVLTGNGFKIDVNGQQMGAKDALNALVTGKYPDDAIQAQFNSRPPAGQALMLLSIFNGYRRGAKAYFRGHDADLQDKIARGQQARAAQLGGAPPEAAMSAPAAATGGGAAAAPHF